MKRYITILSALMLSAAMSLSAFAGELYGWQQDNVGTWFKDIDGTWPANTWKWIPIDDNGTDYVACYYFDNNGYLMTNTTTPDGYKVNEYGMWINDNGEVNVQVDLEYGLAHQFYSNSFADTHR